jgi:transient receptor potential cation channel subfamily M protein 3
MLQLLLFIGEQAMSKALVAARLYQAMANEAADDDLDVEIYDELKSYSKYFEDLCKSQF